VEALTIYESINREKITHLCAAPTVLIAIANGPEAERRRVQRGIKLFGAAFLLGGIGILLTGPSCPWITSVLAGHCLMGTFFGAAQMAYGVYLYFTERKLTS